MIKRNLSGIWIHDSERVPTCFEDCDEQARDNWLNGLQREQLINLAKILGDIIKDIGDQFDVRGV